MDDSPIVICPWRMRVHAINSAIHEATNTQQQTVLVNKEGGKKKINGPAFAQRKAEYFSQENYKDLSFRHVSNQENRLLNVFKSKLSQVYFHGK